MKNFVYKFIACDNSILYVGKTHNIKKRLKEHFSKSTHLPQSCYYEIHKIFYTNVITEYNAELLETYYINKHHPKYNIDKKYKDNDENIEVKIEENIWNELYFLKEKGNSNLKIEILKNKNLPYMNRDISTHKAISLAISYNINKIETNENEFEYFCKHFYSEIKSLQYIKSLYIYAKNNIDELNTNLNEYITNRIENNYIAFNINDIKEIAETIPIFHVLLKYNFIDYIGDNIFILPIITTELLLDIENNVKNKD